MCRVPTKDGVCAERFFTQGALDFHLGLCISRHTQEIHTSSLVARMPVFDPNEWSPEAEAHLAEVGRRMLKEGRLTMHPHERIHNE